MLNASVPESVGTDGIQISWMWADAGVPGALFGGFLAKVNPLRWSTADAADVAAVLDDTSASSTSRPVRLQVVGDHGSFVFDNAADAATWLRGRMVEANGTLQTKRPSIGSVVTSFAACGLATSTAAPALASFCVLHAEGRPWHRKVFASSLYALRITSVYAGVALEQERPPAPQHTRQHIPWSAYEASRARDLAEFMAVASRNEAEMPESIARLDTDWDRFVGDGAERGAHPEASPMVVVFRRRLPPHDVIVAFRGGNGSIEDMKTHLASPARAFIQQVDENDIPLLPVDLLLSLGCCGEVSVLGYSQGAIPALAAALSLSTPDGRRPTWLKEIVLFNFAAAFWPPWMSKLLCKDPNTADWWTALEGSNCVADFATVTSSYMVQGDPLSEGGEGLTMPQAPGRNYVLPTVEFGTNLFANHSFHHFTDAH